MKNSIKNVLTKSTKIRCNGIDSIHPMIYLEISKNKSSIKCPYCGIIYFKEKDSLLTHNRCYKKET